MLRDRSLTWLLAGSALLLGLASGCADEKNPTLPSASNPTVGGKGQVDASKDVVRAPDARTEDAASTTCDVIAQDCSEPSHACYPVNGRGRCLLAGGTGQAGSCVLDEDPPSCAPGLTCIGIGLDNIGQCVYMCDLAQAAAQCGLFTVCTDRSGLPPGIGYCEPV